MDMANIRGRAIALTVLCLLVMAGLHYLAIERQVVRQDVQVFLLIFVTIFFFLFRAKHAFSAAACCAIFAMIFGGEVARFPETIEIKDYWLMPFWQYLALFLSFRLTRAQYIRYRQASHDSKKAYWWLVAEFLVLATAMVVLWHSLPDYPRG